MGHLHRIHEREREDQNIWKCHEIFMFRWAGLLKAGFKQPLQTISVRVGSWTVINLSERLQTLKWPSLWGFRVVLWASWRTKACVQLGPSEWKIGLVVSWSSSNEWDKRLNPTQLCIEDIPWGQCGCTEEQKEALMKWWSACHALS